jgi:hypothetical protein
MQIPGISGGGGDDSSHAAAAASLLAMTNFGIPLTGSRSAIGLTMGFMNNMRE